MTADPTTLRDQIIAALSTAGAYCGDCDFEPGDTGCPDCQRIHRMYAKGVLGVVQAEVESLNRQLGNALTAAQHNVEQLGLASAEVERLNAEIQGLEETAAGAQQNAVHWQEQAKDAEAELTRLRGILREHAALLPTTLADALTPRPQETR